MKTIINAIGLFKKQFSSNIIIIVFFSLLCSVSVYLYNQYEQRTACYTMFSKSDYNILYANLPRGCMNSSSQYIELRNNIDVQAKSIAGYAATSIIFNTNIRITSKNKDKEIKCGMYMVDNTTIKALKYEVKQGRWLSDANILKGMLPCIIGGYCSDEYNIGDILNISFIKGTNVDGEYIQEETQSIKYYVAGKFKDRQQFFNMGGLSSSSKPQPLSDYFNVIDANIYIWAEHNFTFSQIVNIMDYTINSSPIMYFDKSLPRESIDQIIRKIGDVSLFSHQDLLAEEKLKIAEDYEFILPVMVMIAIVSAVGIYSMCMLNVFRNYNMFAIFYLCGCSKRKNILIVAAYSSFFMIFTSIIVGVIYCVFTYLIHFEDPYISQYIYVNVNHIASIVLVCFSMSFLSFITPFTLLRKLSISNQLNVE